MFIVAQGRDGSLSDMQYIHTVVLTGKQYKWGAKKTLYRYISRYKIGVVLMMFNVTRSRSNENFKNKYEVKQF